LFEGFELFELFEGFEGPSKLAIILKGGLELPNWGTKKPPPE